MTMPRVTRTPWLRWFAAAVLLALAAAAGRAGAQVTLDARPSATAAPNAVLAQQSANPAQLPAIPAQPPTDPAQPPTATAPAGGAQPWSTGTDGLVPIPPLKSRVTDLTNTLGPGPTQALEAKLAAWEQRTGNQLVVLMVPTTKPEPIEAYSIRVAEAWKIGRKGQDNGALLLVAKDDRKLRIEVGYGFEGSLTDATSRRIIAETIAPLFRQDRYAQGIEAGADQIIAVVDKGEPLAARPAAKPAKGFGGGISFEMLLIFVFVVVPVLGGLLRRIFGKPLGSTVGAGIVGTAAWVLAASIPIAVLAGIVAFFVMLFFGGGGGGGFSRRGGGVWMPSGGGGWGGAAAAGDSPAVAVALAAAGRREDGDDAGKTHLAASFHRPGRRGTRFPE